MEISNTITSFLTHVRVEKGLSANTVSAYRRDLVKFENYAKKKKLSLEDVTRDDLVEFLASLFRQKLESRTVARHLVTLRNFFRFALTQDLITVDPALNLESFESFELIRIAFRDLCPVDNLRPGTRNGNGMDRA